MDNGKGERWRRRGWTVNMKQRSQPRDDNLSVGRVDPLRKLG